MNAEQARQLTAQAKVQYEDNQREEYRKIQELIKAAAMGMKSNLVVENSGGMLLELLRQDGFQVRTSSRGTESYIDISW